MNQILAYLNTNAGAIQALASVLSFLATIVLAIITWRYVALTKVLAKAAATELNLKRKEMSGQERKLLMLLQTFKSRMNSLPLEEKYREDIRKNTSWDNEEIETMRTLSTGIEHCSPYEVSLLSERLKWVKDQVDRVKATDPRTGFDWGLFSWPRWQEEIMQSKADIATILLDVLHYGHRESENT